ncbi:MAG: alpha/beta hydrolase [Pseudomonadota bacterium]
MKITVDDRSVFVGDLNRGFESNRPTVTFVHGAAMDHSVWTMFARYFVRHGHNVVALDLPGHGQSEGNPLPSITELSSWLGRALETIGVSSTTLIGHSMGSLVALEFAATAPDRVDRLGLVGTAVPMAVTDALLEAAKSNESAAFNMVTIWSHGPNAHIGGISSPGMWLPRGGLRLMEKSQPGSLFADLTACNEYTTGLEQAAKITCPTLLILGERDMMTPPRAAAKLQAALPGAQSVVLKGVGHSLMSEDPNGLLDALITLTTLPEAA